MIHHEGREILLTGRTRYAGQVERCNTVQVPYGANGAGGAGGTGEAGGVGDVGPRGRASGSGCLGRARTGADDPE